MAETKTLIDIYNERPDVASMVKGYEGDPFTSGTKANTALNDWWNSNGSKEYAGVSLVQPNQTSTPKVDVPTEIPSSLLSGQKTTESDIASLIENRNALYKQYEATQKPSTEVTDLQNQVADIGEKISNVENSRDLGKTEAGQKVMAMDAIYGQQQAIEQRATALLNTYNSQQKNLLTRLGYAKEAQELKQTTLSNLLSYTNDDLNIQFKIQDRVDTQIKDYQARLDKQSEDAKDEINTIVSLYSQSGKDFNDLSEADKLSITQKATAAGLDLNLIQYGLKSVKDQYLYSQSVQQKKDALELQAQQANIAQSYASIAASKASIANANTPTSYREWSLAGGLKGTGKTYSEWLSSNSSSGKVTNTDRVNAINQGLKDNKAFGGDGKVSYETYTWMLQNWVNNGGTENEFYANYPKSQYLDDNNRYLFDNQK